MKKLILLCSSAIVLPTAAFAQSTGTVATEEQTIVITGTRVNNGVNGIVVPDTTKAKGVITQEFIARQSPGQTILNTINYIPGVNFTNSDPYGSAGGNIRIRGFDGNRISLTFDGVPLNDSGNYAIFSNQQLDPELIEQVNVGLGVTDVDSPTASAAGGTVNYRTLIPARTLGARGTVSVGTDDYRRFFGMISPGEFGPWGTRAWASYSVASNDKFKGPGKINKKQFNARVYQTLGNNGDFLSLGAHYNRNRNNFYRNPSVSDLRAILGVSEIPTAIGAFPDSGNPLRIGYISDRQFDVVEDFENLGSCNRTVAVRGVIQNDNGGTGPNGTLTPAPALPVTPGSTTSLGSTANNPLNSSSCSNYFGVRINPSDTGNVRGQSRFTLADGVLLTIDPSFQYVLANGGGSTVFSETARQLRGTNFATVGGLDLNRDGDLLDSIRLLSPNNTNTHRFGLTSSLIWEFSPQHRARIAYTFDRAHHRQTGEFGFLNVEGSPLDPFGGRDANAVLDANGNVLQQRDRTSIALLNQISGQYIGKFFDEALRVEVGVRRPFFKRELDQNCYTLASGAGFAYCSSEVLGTTPIAATAGNFIVPADFRPAIGAAVPTNAVYAPFEADYKFGKLLPSVGFTYKVTGPVSIFGSYAKGFSAPRTDNLYRTPRVDITPEETNAFDLGVRYTDRMVQAQATAWKIDYKNRIVSSFDPDLGISLDRNVGKVDSYGFDASVAIKPIRNLSLLALASYIKTELQENVQINSVRFNATTPVAPQAGLIFCDSPPTAANPIAATCAPTAGKRVTETPKLQYGGRAEYTFGPVSVGAQAKWVGSRFATDTNDVKVKGYALVDLDARVSLVPIGLDRSHFQLNVQNLLDERYFGNIGTQINNAGNPNFAVGSPRSVIGTLNFQF